MSTLNCRFESSNRSEQPPAFHLVKLGLQFCQDDESINRKHDNGNLAVSVNICHCTHRSLISNRLLTSIVSMQYHQQAVLIETMWTVSQFEVLEFLDSKESWCLNSQSECFNGFESHEFYRWITKLHLKRFIVQHSNVYRVKRRVLRCDPSEDPVDWKQMR